VAAGVIYMVTMSRGPYPGESAGLVVQFTGLFPQMVPTHTLWHGVVWLIDRLPGSSATALNLLSVLCGAVSVWLLCEVLSAAVRLLVDQNDENRARVLAASRLAGACAALTLAFCVPFWMVANRAHPASFDLLLLLVLARLFLRFVRQPSVLLAALFALLYGVGMVEYPTLIVMGPLWAAAMLFLLWRREALLQRYLLTALVCGALGGSVVFLRAALFLQAPGYALRGYTGFWQLLRYMWLAHWGAVTGSLPREGWLIILMVTVMPWLTALMVARRGLNEERDWSYYLLHLILTGLTVAVVAETPLSPWRQAGPGRLLVTPYLLSAVLAGYLAAYWFLLPSAHWLDAESKVLVWLRRWLGGMLVLPLLVLVLAMPFRNAARADGRQARIVNRMASELLDALGGRTWLVTDGTLDSHLLILARERGLPLKLVDLTSGRSHLYRRVVAAGLDSDRMKNLADISLLAMLQDWMSGDAAAAEQLAVQAFPDLWIGAGYTPVPERCVFVGARGLPSAADLRESLGRHERFWTFAASLPAADGPPAPADPLVGLLCRRFAGQAALAANNLGVLLEDAKLPDEAFRAYTGARRVDAGNISSLLNMNVMVDRGFASADAERVRRELDMLLRTLESKLRVWSLARHSGYVRMPQAYADLGWTWALSGQPGLAVAGLRKAMELMPEGHRSQLKQTLAGLYLAQEDDARSAALYRELLNEDPQNRKALLGMAHVCLRRGEFNEAQDWVRKAEAAGVDRRRIALVMASLHAAAGDAPRARIVLEELLDLNPGLAAGWRMLVAVLVMQRDEEGLRKCLQKMEQEGARGREFLIAIGRGHLALMKGEWDAARDDFSRALLLQSRNAHALEMILRLDVGQGRQRDAEAHARTLLQADPGHALANHVMGAVYLQKGNRAMAEASYRRSLERERRAEVLNDLAWILQEDARGAEAEKLVREALDLDPGLAGAWDTLGVILADGGRLEDARTALQKSLSLVQEHPGVFLHLAEVEAKLENRQEALDLVEMLMEKRAVLSPEDDKRLMTLRERLLR
jgi:Tfp pilus assembly protein PilF